MGPCRGTLQCGSIRTISRCKERKVSCLFCKIRIKRKRCSAADEMLTSNCLLVIIYLWINISHVLVCLLTLDLTTFEQRVCSTKIGYANALLLRANSNKIWSLSTVCIKQKKQSTFHSGLFERQQVYEVYV